MNNKSNMFEQQKNVKEIEEIVKDSKLWDSIDSVANSIVEARNSAAAMVFAEHIGKLLRDNGVNVKGTIYHAPPLNDDLPNVTIRYCSDIEGIDFSEHDKDFLSDIKCLSDQKWQLEREIEGLKEEIDRIKKLNDECCEENIRLNRENKELRKQIEEIDLVGNLPYEPIEVAQMLINATHTYETSELQRVLGKGETDSYNIYDISALRQIAEHLLVYCNNNKDD